MVMSVGAFSDICFGGVGLFAADMVKCQATKPEQHMFAASSWREKHPYSLRGTA